MAFRLCTFVLSFWEICWGIARLTYGLSAPNSGSLLLGVVWVTAGAITLFGSLEMRRG